MPKKYLLILCSYFFLKNFCVCFLETKLAPNDFFDLSSDEYIQTYCILKADERGSAMRDVLFRFGSWCYIGNVELVPRLALEDLPYIIPALRVQHSKMKFLCDVRWLPCNNRFTAALVDAARISTVMEKEVVKNEQVLASLNELMILPTSIRSSSTDSSEEDAISSDPPQTAAVLDWLDRQKTIFEFHFAPDKISKKIYSNIELIATKRFNPCGVVSISIYCAGKFYLTLGDLQGKEQRLLDSRFPNVAAKGKGFKLHSYPKGVEDWPQLRHLSIWESMSCSEDESTSFEINEDEEGSGDTNSTNSCEGVDLTHSSKRRSGILEFSEGLSERQITDIIKPCCKSNEGWRSEVNNREEEDKRHIMVSDAPATDVSLKEKTIYGTKSPNKFEWLKDKTDVPNLGWEHTAAEFPRIPTDEKTDSTTGVGTSVEEDEYPEFLSSPSLRIPKKKAKSVGSASGSTSIKKVKVNLGAFHYLAPLARSTRENRTTLRELKYQHESLMGENSEPWDNDGRPKY